MNTPLKILATACALLTLPALATAEDTCKPRVIDSPTVFPIRSQIRGQEGIVYIDVKIDSSGRAASTELQQSSGYRLLDRAAQQSVKNNWVFDISDCVRKDLPATHRVAVDYRNAEY
jgi:TonB family protein